GGREGGGVGLAEGGWADLAGGVRGGGAGQVMAAGGGGGGSPAGEGLAAWHVGKPAATLRLRPHGGQRCNGRATREGAGRRLRLRPHDGAGLWRSGRRRAGGAPRRVHLAPPRRLRLGAGGAAGGRAR